MLKIRTLTASDVEFSLETRPEEDAIEGHFSYDTEEETKEAVATVRRLAEQSEWGWCVVTVRATYKGFECSTALCGCSYESEEDFKAGGYYLDMCGEALDCLNTEIQDIAARLPVAS